MACGKVGLADEPRALSAPDADKGTAKGEGHALAGPRSGARAQRSRLDAAAVHHVAAPRRARGRAREDRGSPPGQGTARARGAHLARRARRGSRSPRGSRVAEEGPPEPRHVREAAEGPSQVARYAAHVRLPLETSRSTTHAAASGSTLTSRASCTVTRRALSSSSSPARAAAYARPAPHGDGRVTRGDLVLLAHQAPHLGRRALGVEQGAVNVGDGGHLAVGVVGRGLGAQREGRAVPLAVEREQPKEPGRLPHAHDEDARRGRVERSSVPHAALAERPADASDDVMAGEAGWLVNGKERREPALGPRLNARPPLRRRARGAWGARRRAPWSMSPSTVKPAAAG